MANINKNFKVKNGLEVKGSATIDNDASVLGTLSAKANTPSADSDIVNKAYVDTAVADTHDSAAVVGQINLEVDKAFVDALNVDAETLGGNDSSYYLDYNNFTNTPTLPAQVISSDSASELADSAVNARTDQDLFTTSDVEFNKVTSNLVGSVHFMAKNDEGSDLVEGDVVYINGISGNTPTVAKADADDAAKMPAFGIISSGNSNGANVTVTTFGEITGLNTSTLSLGDTLYVATVAGAYTNTKPTGEGSLLQNVGQVTRVDASGGSIKVLGAGRTAATPNLNENNIFIGNASNQAVTMSLDDAVDSDHVQSKIKQSFIDTFDTHDSAAVAGQIADTLNDTVVITKNSADLPALRLQATINTDSAAPIMEFVKNTSQANSGDYLGQIKFLGEDSSGTAQGTGIVYAKITGKISDPTDGTEDGLIEYMVKSNGSNEIIARMTGNGGGKLIMENGASIEVASGGNITIDDNEVLTTASDTHDSAAVQGQIDATLASDVTVGGNLTVNGYIAGPSTMTIDPATVGTDSGTLIILGDLQVEGETTTVNSTTVSIADKNIILADSATTASQANDAGITINAANATMQYKATGDKWEFNKPLFHGADRVLTTADDLHDSDLVQGQIDTTIAALDTHDSAAVVGQINLEVDADFVEAIRPAETIFDLSPTVSGNYTFSGDGFPSNVDDPVLHLTRGKTYKFANISGSHPLEIRTSAGGSAYSSGVTNNGGSGSVVFTVPMDAPNKLYYQCTVHSSMLGTIYIDEIVSFDSDISMTGDLTVTGNISVNGNDVLTTASDTHDSAATQGQIDSSLDQDVTIGGILNVTHGDATDDIIDIGKGRSTSGVGELNIITSGTSNSYTDHGFRITRAAGDDGVTKIENRGFGGLDIDGVDGSAINIKTGGNDVIVANADRSLTFSDYGGANHNTGTVSKYLAVTSSGGVIGADVPTIDSATIQPFARAAFADGTNIDYDSSTGTFSTLASPVFTEVTVDTLTPSTDSALSTKAYVDSSIGAIEFEGTSSAHTLAIALLDTTLPQALDVGDPIYYDSDTAKWTGAKATTTDVASHVIVEKDGVNFKIAQTGVFTLTPHQGLDINSYYYLDDSAGFYTSTQPTIGINQTLFYAVDSSTIDVNIAEAVDLTAVNTQALKEEILADAIGAATAMAIVF